MQIRAAAAADWPALWPLVKGVVDAGDTYAWQPTPSSEQMQKLWLEPPPWQVFVAEVEGRLIGTAKVGPNRPGRGAHVATASFMVSPDHQGLGIGRQLGHFAVDWAHRTGYLAMQFNAVVETNLAAIALWRSLGFGVIGTVPRAFSHPTEGLVGLHIMYRSLVDGPVIERPDEVRSPRDD
ncbi:MAG: GNAT family N-acetyltransferase [Actinomycetes bacterium]